MKGFSRWYVTGTLFDPTHIISCSPLECLFKKYIKRNLLFPKGVNLERGVDGWVNGSIVMGSRFFLNGVTYKLENFLRGDHAPPYISTLEYKY